jgi:hypothetical protein
MRVSVDATRPSPVMGERVPALAKSEVPATFKAGKSEERTARVNVTRAPGSNVSGLGESEICAEALDP